MPTQIENVELYDVEEVSQVIGKHPNTVRSYLKDGTIKGEKINDAWYVTRTNLEGIVEELDFPISIIEHRLGLKLPKDSSSKLANQPQ